MLIANCLSRVGRSRVEEIASWKIMHKVKSRASKSRVVNRELQIPHQHFSYIYSCKAFWKKTHIQKQKWDLQQNRSSFWCFVFSNKKNEVHPQTYTGDKQTHTYLLILTWGVLLMAGLNLVIHLGSLQNTSGS